MFSFFKKKAPPRRRPPADGAIAPRLLHTVEAVPSRADQPAGADRRHGWFDA
jgi:hypothetical protein